MERNGLKDVLAIGAALIDIVALIDKFPGIDQEVFVPKLELMGGGSAANFAVACARMGLKTGFVGKLGSDSFGERLLQEFKKDNVETEKIVFNKEIQTGICYAAVDKRGNRILYAFSGAANDLQPKDLDGEYLKAFQVIHLASLKNIDPLVKAAELVQGTKTRVCLNPGSLIVDQGLKTCEKLLKLTQIFIGSQGEVKQLFQTDDLSEGLDRLLNYVEIAAITQGEKGSLIADKDFQTQLLAEKVKVVDTTGAGDAFSAGFIYGLLRFNFDHSKLDICGKLGNKAAASKIQAVGARGGLLTASAVSEILKQLNKR